MTIENLFIGNELEEGRVPIYDVCTVVLRRVRNPIIIFSSYGDNITPPHQALGWNPVVYRDTDDLKASGQRVVYLTNPHVEHLETFGSTKVARPEHGVIVEALRDVSRLPPGPYKMKIDNPAMDPDCRKPRSALEWLHPMQTSRNLLTASLLPALYAVSAVARIVERGHHVVPPDKPSRIAEERLSDGGSEGALARPPCTRRRPRAVVSAPSIGTVGAGLGPTAGERRPSSSGPPPARRILRPNRPRAIMGHAHGRGPPHRHEPELPRRDLASTRRVRALVNPEGC